MLFYGYKNHILFNSYRKITLMSSKKSEKSEKTEDKRDKSAMAEINNIEKTIRNLTASLNKLKIKFKTKGESTKKE